MAANRSLAVAVTLIVTLFVGCSRSTLPSSPTAVAPSATPAVENLAAPDAVVTAGVVSNTIVPIPPNTVLFDSCTGEGVHVTGTIHVVTVSTTDASGGTHTQRHFNVQGVTGVGVVSGTQYRGIHTETHDANSSGGAGSEFTTRIDIKLVAEGSASNLTIRDALVHVTVNANGVETASIDNLTLAECQ
jgi:hypothetical protein